jgi:hypothetical protein
MKRVAAERDQVIIDSQPVRSEEAIEDFSEDTAAIVADDAAAPEEEAKEAANG